jgi:transposase InsO family protein
MQRWKEQYKLRVLCAAFEVSASGFYRWQRAQRQPSRRAGEDAQIGARLCELHEQSRRTYGRPRLMHALQAEGHRHSPKRVARLMKRHGLCGVQRGRFKPRTTQSDPALGVAPNLRPGPGAAPTQPNQLWVADITYVQTKEGWLYVASVVDQASRRVLGLAMGARLQTGLAEAALREALGHGRPSSNLIHHSDRGLQYASGAYRALLSKHRLTASMSRRGNCYDNAHMESFWGTLKAELIEGRTFATRREAELAVFEYVHCFYNRVRRHSALHYQSPIEYEAKLASKLEDVTVRHTQPSGVGSGGTDLSATPVLKANP